MSTGYANEISQEEMQMHKKTLQKVYRLNCKLKLTQCTTAQLLKY